MRFVDILKTSEVNWLESAIKSYSEKTRFTFIDDVNLDITDEDLKSAVILIRGVRKKNDQTWKSIIRVLAGMGMSGMGIYTIGLAIVDLEHIAKLGLFVGGGFLLFLTGSLSLGVTFNVSASSIFGRFEVSPIYALYSRSNTKRPKRNDEVWGVLNLKVIFKLKVFLQF